MKSTISAKGAAVPEEVQPEAQPVSNNLNSIDYRDTLAKAIYAYINERRLAAPENLPMVRTNLAKLIGSKPETVEAAFLGRSYSMAVNYTASRPDDFNAYYAGYQHSQNVIYSFMGTLMALGGSAMWSFATHPDNTASGVLLAIVGTLLGGYSLVSLFTAKAEAEPDERQDEFRTQVKAFVGQFEDIETEPEIEAAPGCAYCGSVLTGSRCVNCGAPVLHHAKGFEGAELAAH